MNRKRRAEIDRAERMINAAIMLLTEVMEGETEAVQNMPEALQASGRGDASQACIDAIEQVMGDLTDLDFDACRGGNR